MNNRLKLIYLPAAILFVFLGDALQILDVLVLQHRTVQFAHLGRGDPAFAQRDAFQTGHFQPLPLLNRLDVVCDIGQIVVPICYDDALLY